MLPSSCITDHNPITSSKFQIQIPDCSKLHQSKILLDLYQQIERLKYCLVLINSVLSLVTAVSTQYYEVCKATY